MANNRLVNVIIPVYKEFITPEERMSLRQCVKILSAHPITLVSSGILNLSVYLSEYPNFKIEYFDKSYFKDIEGYNELLMSSGFYKRFRNFRYLLIFQLDAWVFRDDLEYWCQKGYDYIGAPWFKGWHEASLDAPIIGVGNGGFSLRRSRKILKLVRRINIYQIIYKIFKISKLNVLFRRNYYLSKLIDRIETIVPKNTNEDYHIFNLSLQFKWFKIAPSKDASLFSFDVNPEILYKLNNSHLPFGCHAWSRYNSAFWRQFIGD